MEEPSSAAGSLPLAVARHARLTPDATAVTCEGLSLSYRELNSRANRLGATLRARGAGPGMLVALCMPRGIEFIVALLAVLKTGAAYLPLDPDYPVARLKKIIKRAAPGLLLTQSSIARRLAGDGDPGIPVLCTDLDAPAIAAASDHELSRPVAPQDPCYVIFTSGSTGEPKGVVVTHGNVRRLFTHLGPRLSMNPADVWSQVHSAAFGFSVFEIWGALTSGACLAIAPAAVRADGRALHGFLRSAGVTILSQTPTAFRGTLLSPAWPGGWPDLALRLVVLSGEAVMARDLQRWSECHGAAGPRLVNTYAITETGGNVMFREYAAGDHDARNLGVPLADVTVHVLDAAHRPVAPGEPGELYVGGPGVAAGYLHDAALTAARFLAIGPDAARVYRTGDMVRTIAGGALEFLGRVDEQVKWRGYRLELGEIESLLRTHPGISAAAAAIRADEAGQEKLVAYVVPHGVPGAGAAAPGEPEFWPSLGGYQVYDDFLYDLMSTDPVRSEAFRTAFQRHARGRVVLDLGAGPHALLARLAVEAGARRVYAVEVLPEAARKARAAVEAAGLSERITIIEADAARQLLPEPADVCTQGIIGNIGSADGIAPIWNRVRGQFRPGFIPVPARCTTLIAAVELPEALRDRPVFAPLAQAYVKRIFQAEGRHFDLRLCVRNLPGNQVISDCHVFEDLDFSTALPETWQGEAQFTLNRAGRFDGFLLWTVVTLSDGVALDYLQHQHAWLPVFLPLPEDGPWLPRDAIIHARWNWSAGSDGVFPDYSIHSEFSVDGVSRSLAYTSRHHGTSHGGTAIHRRLFDLQSSSGGGGLAPGELRAWLAQHLPEPLLPNAWMYLDALPVNPNGKLDRRALPTPGQRTWGGQGGAPRSALESDLAAIWSDILGVAAVGMQDNFFDLGGDSIAAVRLTTRLQQLLDDGVMLAAVFEAPTLASLARYLADHHGGAVASHYGRQQQPAQPKAAPALRQHGEI